MDSQSTSGRSAHVTPINLLRRSRAGVSFLVRHFFAGGARRCDDPPPPDQSMTCLLENGFAMRSANAFSKRARSGRSRRADKSFASRAGVSFLVRDFFAGGAQRCHDPPPPDQYDLSA